MKRLNNLEFITASTVTPVLTMLAVALGGYLVFRTKKESHEKLFSVQDPVGTAYVSDPNDEEFDPFGGFPAGLGEMAKRFKEQVKNA